jgi:hypothetical protein
MHKTTIDIAENTPKAAMQAQLADVVDLGPSFIALHDLFEKVAEDGLPMRKRKDNRCIRPPAPAASLAPRRPAEDSEARLLAMACHAGDQDAVELSSIESVPASDRRAGFLEPPRTKRDVNDRGG